LTLVSLSAFADTVVTGSSSHATTRADLFTDSAAVFNWIRAVNSTTVTADTDITLLGADNRLAANVKSELSTATASAAVIFEAESGLRASALAVEGTSEALGTGISTESLDIGESSIAISIGIVAVVALARVDPLAVIRSRISGA